NLFVLRLILLLFTLISSYGLTQTTSAKPPSGLTSDGPLDRAGTSDVATNVPSAPGVKRFEYGERDVLRLNAKLRYTTLIVLPKNEQILDFTCGDKEFWIVNGTQNFASVKPARPKTQTNLNLITARGNLYSFVLTVDLLVFGLELD